MNDKTPYLRSRDTLPGLAPARFDAVNSVHICLIIAAELNQYRGQGQPMKMELPDHKKL